MNTTKDDSHGAEAGQVKRPVRPLSKKQYAHIGREIARHINAGATIAAQKPCDALRAMPDGSVYGGLIVTYPPAA